MDFDPAVEGARILAAGEPVVQGAMTRRHRWGPVAWDVLGDRGAVLFEVRTRRRRGMLVSHQERQPSGEWVEVWRNHVHVDPRGQRSPLAGTGRLLGRQQASSGEHAYVVAQAPEGIELVRVQGRDVPVSAWGWLFALRPQRRRRGPRPAMYRRRTGWANLRRVRWWHRRRRDWPEIEVVGVTADGTEHAGRLVW
jgi:hypothetical protein